MNSNPIISRAESLRILKNQLRQDALQKRAEELRDASPAKREAILIEIEHDVENAVQKHALSYPFGKLIN